MDPAITMFLFFFGALWGSFFYTLALRYTGGEMESSPFRALFSRSKCPLCGEKISPLSLVPLLGYLALRGKCRKCHGDISPLYPIAELLSGLLLILLIRDMGLYPGTMLIFILIETALAVAVIDIKTLTIPDGMVMLFLLVSLYPMSLHNDALDSLYGFLLMSGFFLVILLIFPGSFGGGDLKFAAVIGLYSGLELSIVVLETALVSGTLAGILYALITKRGFRSKIPFGPFLALGLIVSVFFGQDIALLYYRFIR